MLNYYTLYFLCFIAVASTLITVNFYHCFYQETNYTPLFFDKAIRHLSGNTVLADNCTVQRLFSGMSGAHLYTLTLDNKKYVIRFLNKKYSAAKRKSEINAHKEMAAIGVAPPVLYIDTHARYIILPFIEGHALSHKDRENKTILTKLGQMLAKVHQTKTSAAVQTTQFERIVKHFNRIKKNNIALPSQGYIASKEYISDYRPVKKQLNGFCHGDLNPTNIIIRNSDQKIFIIDWTTGATDNIYTDLGFFMVTNTLTQQQKELFLTAYFDRAPTQSEYSNLAQGENAAYLHIALIWFSFSEGFWHKLLPKKYRINWLNRLLQDSLLPSGWDYLKTNTLVPVKTGSYTAIKRCATGFIKSYFITKKGHV